MCYANSVVQSFGVTESVDNIIAITFDIIGRDNKKVLYVVAASELLDAEYKAAQNSIRSFKKE